MFKKGFLLLLTCSMVQVQTADVSIDVQDRARVQQHQSATLQARDVIRHLPPKPYMPAMVCGLIATVNHISVRSVYGNTLDRIFNQSQSFALGSALLGYCVQKKKWAYVPAAVSCLCTPILIILFGVNRLDNNLNGPTVMKHMANLARILTPALFLGGYVYDSYTEEQTQKCAQREQESIALD